MPTRIFAGSPNDSFTLRSLLDRFAFTAGGFREDLALVDAVERRAQLRSAARADDVAADVLEEPELVRIGVEGDEEDLHRPFALAIDVAGDVGRIAAVGVVAVGDDQQVLAED